MAPKQMKAKYASVCPLCNNKINVNDDVMWEKGKKAKHLPGKCPTIHTRVDMTTYAAALRNSRNMKVMGPAGVKSRSGNVFVAEAAPTKTLWDEYVLAFILGAHCRPETAYQYADEVMAIRAKRGIK